MKCLLPILLLFSLGTHASTQRFMDDFIKEYQRSTRSFRVLQDKLFKKKICPAGDFECLNRELKAIPDKTAGDFMIKVKLLWNFAEWTIAVTKDCNLECQRSALSSAIDQSLALKASVKPADLQSFKGVTEDNQYVTAVQGMEEFLYFSACEMFLEKAIPAVEKFPFPSLKEKYLPVLKSYIDRGDYPEASFLKMEPRHKEKITAKFSAAIHDRPLVEGDLLRFETFLKEKK